MRWAITMGHSDRMPRTTCGREKGPLPEHVPGRISSAGVLFLHCESGMGKDLCGVHRKNVHKGFS